METRRRSSRANWQKDGFNLVRVRALPGWDFIISVRDCTNPRRDLLRVVRNRGDPQRDFLNLVREFKIPRGELPILVWKLRDPGGERGVPGEVDGKIGQ